MRPEAKMFQTHNRAGPQGTPDINVTPLADVSLVLVLILLLAAPLAFESAIAVRKAAMTGKVARENTRETRVELNVVSEDIVQVNDVPVNRSNLRNRLRPILEETSLHAVAVACAGEVSHGAFVDVLDQARRCGVDEIAIVGR
jgi:biopolymer transport protein ExbD